MKGLQKVKKIKSLDLLISPESDSNFCWLFSTWLQFQLDYDSNWIYNNKVWTLRVSNKWIIAMVIRNHYSLEYWEFNVENLVKESGVLSIKSTSIRTGIICGS